MKPNHPFAGALWLWPGDFYEMHNTYAQFRRDFHLGRAPAKAPFHITADQCYMLYVNGEYVGRGPARGYQVSWPYDTYDLAPYLVRGHNWISVRAYNAAISTFQYMHQGVAGFLCAARWGTFTLVSDTQWQMRLSPAHARDTARLSMQINFQEHVDAREDDQSWIRSPRAPAGWPELKRTCPLGAMPWHGFEPRGIPNLSNTVLPYARTVTAAAGRCAKDYAAWSNPTRGHYYAEREGLRWRAAPPGRAAKGGLAVTLPATGPGRLAAVSLDLGQLAIGNLRVEATGAAGGEIVDFFHCEALEPDGSPVMADKWSACGASMTARLRLAKGRTRHEFFQMIGHRYLVVIVRDTRRPIALKLACRETIYPFDMKGRFACDDHVLADIHRISVRTQRICAIDAYVDTPWREQAQWWGDARVQIQNTFHMSGDVRLVERGIRSIARQDVPNGLTYGHAPTMAHNCILPDFSLIWILTIWDTYWQTGDLGLFREQWPRIERLLGYFAGEGRGRTGLLARDPRYWLFLDWSTIHKVGTPTVYNLWYLLALEKLVALTGAAGMAPERRRLAAMYREQKRLSLAAFWNRREGLFRDGLDPDGRPVREHSIHSQTMAILCGLQRAAHPIMVARRLRPYLEGHKVPGALPSSYWVTYVYDAMRSLGYGLEVVRHIRRQWAPMIPYGGTWEQFDGRIGHSSTSHAWAAHPIYHLAATLGGVSQTDVAWRRIAFAPVFDMPETNDVSVTVPTPQGLVRAAWKRSKKGIDVRLGLPRGVAAAVRLPG
ncbi:MAG: alpha-L-rhamnosidase, partial [Planctomycetes bacterium]|nr:alpha-L-rhamnosidase [Planctomycetota bacterium]